MSSFRFSSVTFSDDSVLDLIPANNISSVSIGGCDLETDEGELLSQITTDSTTELHKLWVTVTNKGLDASPAAVTATGLLSNEPSTTLEGDLWYAVNSPASLTTSWAAFSVGAVSLPVRSKTPSQAVSGAIAGLFFYAAVCACQAIETVASANKKTGLEKASFLNHAQIGNCKKAPPLSANPGDAEGKR